jgi:hypothetical protein
MKFTNKVMIFILRISRRKLHVNFFFKISTKNVFLTSIWDRDHPLLIAINKKKNSDNGHLGNKGEHLFIINTELLGKALSNKACFV